MDIILPLEILDYIFEFINFNNIISRLNLININKYDLYMFFLKNNMNSYYESAHASHKMKILEREKDKIFRKCCTRLLIFNNFVQTCSTYYIKGHKGLKLDKRDEELFKSKLILK